MAGGPIAGGMALLVWVADPRGGVRRPAAGALYGGLDSQRPVAYNTAPRGRKVHGAAASTAVAAALAWLPVGVPAACGAAPVGVVGGVTSRDRSPHRHRRSSLEGSRRRWAVAPLDTVAGGRAPPP